MMTALEGLWHQSCKLSPASVGWTVAEVARMYYSVYIIYCSNAIYQNRKLNQLT